MNDMTPGGIRQRSRIAPVARQTAPVQVAPARVGDGDTSWMKSGEAAVLERQRAEQAKAQEAAERARQVRAPMRFKLDPGAQSDIIILDDGGMSPGMYEHERFLQNGPKGRKYTWETCPGEWDHCPLCDGVGGFGPRYYVRFLTVLDLTPYTIKSGQRAGVTIPVTKKLMPIKIEGQDWFDRRTQKYGGSLRGLHLVMRRPTNQTSAKIGHPDEEVTKYSEDELRAFLEDNNLAAEQKDQHGNVVKEAYDLIKPYNWGVLFPKPSGDDLRARYGGAAPAGSRQDNEWGGNDPGQAQAPVQRGSNGPITPRSSGGVAPVANGAGAGGGVQPRGIQPRSVQAAQTGALVGSSNDDMDGVDPDDIPLD